MARLRTLLGSGSIGAAIKMLFAAVHESGPGTFETRRPTLTLSVSRGRPEVVGRRPKGQRRDSGGSILSPITAHHGIYR